VTVNRKWTLLSGMAMCVAVAAGGCSSAPARGHDIDGPGPLAGQDARTAYALPVGTPAVFTDGFALINLPGTRPATILKIESIGGESTFEFLGAKLADPTRGTSTQQAMPGWPTRATGAKTYDPKNFVAQPLSKTANESGYEILMGYKIKSDKPAVRTGIRVTYRIDSKTYQAVLPSAFALCAPNTDEDQKCVDDAYDVAGKG
jgi:hypothetical protein